MNTIDRVIKEIKTNPLRGYEIINMQVTSLGKMKEYDFSVKKDVFRDKFHFRGQFNAGMGYQGEGKPVCVMIDIEKDRNGDKQIAKIVDYMDIICRVSGYSWSMNQMRVRIAGDETSILVITEIEPNQATEERIRAVLEIMLATADAYYTSSAA